MVELTKIFRNVFWTRSIWIATSLNLSIPPRWDDNDICFVLDQHICLGFDSPSFLKQQTMSRHVAPPQSTLYWLQINQSLLLLLTTACLGENLYYLYIDMIWTLFNIKKWLKKLNLIFSSELVSRFKWSPKGNVYIFIQIYIYNKDLYSYIKDAYNKYVNWNTG